MTSHSRTLALSARIRGSGRGLAFAVLVASASLGCGGAVQEAARTAAPAAVEGAAKEAGEPETRGAISDVLDDPRIHEATSDLAGAVVEGALTTLTDEERSTLVDRAIDDFVARSGSAVARSLRTDIGPELSAVIADAVDRSLARALDESTEKRLQEIAAAVTRGTVEALTNEVSGGAADPNQRFGSLIRDVSRQAAFGVEDAVREAEQRERTAGQDDPRVLAAAGRAADATFVLTSFVTWGLVLIGLALSIGLIWALVRLRQSRRELWRLRANEEALRGGPRGPTLGDSSAYAR
ncbi:MAG TPA: hypothetical protein VKY73_15000 [Polyangiaceae bacterium]|nr:hypothetical protein [Polyangiaceae bacterium]